MDAGCRRLGIWQRDRICAPHGLAFRLAKRPSRRRVAPWPASWRRSASGSGSARSPSHTPGVEARGETLARARGQGAASEVELPGVCARGSSLGSGAGRVCRSAAARQARLLKAVGEGARVSAMKQIWTGRIAQAAGRYGEQAPMATVCCNICRSRITTNPSASPRPS